MKREVVHFIKEQKVKPELDSTLCGRLVNYKNTTSKPYHVSCHTCRSIENKLRRGK